MPKSDDSYSTHEDRVNFQDQFENKLGSLEFFSVGHVLILKSIREWKDLKETQKNRLSKDGFS